MLGFLFPVTCFLLPFVLFSPYDKHSGNPSPPFAMESLVRDRKSCATYSALRGPR